jgi:hypothetical protein
MDLEAPLREGELDADWLGGGAADELAVRSRSRARLFLRFAVRWWRRDRRLDRRLSRSRLDELASSDPLSSLRESDLLLCRRFLPWRRLLGTAVHPGLGYPVRLVLSVQNNDNKKIYNNQ